jgi:flagellar capping protein FliD
MGTTSAAGLITPLTFTGQSTYSAQFQQVIDKAVQIQEIPLDGMADQANTDQSRQSALQSLDQALTTLQSAVTGLQTAVGSQALSSTVSDPSVASVSLASDAVTGVYQLEVDSLMSFSSTSPTFKNASAELGSYLVASSNRPRAARYPLLPLCM